MEMLTYLEEETGKGKGTVARALFTDTIRRHSYRGQILLQARYWHSL